MSSSLDRVGSSSLVAILSVPGLSNISLFVCIKDTQSGKESSAYAEIKVSVRKHNIRFNNGVFQTVKNYGK